MKSIGIILICFITIFVSLPGWAADEYPNKPIQLVCPFAAGSLTDLSARTIAEKMGEFMGQPVLVVNKPGGGSSLGTAFVAASKPDGYAILTSWSGVLTILPLIQANLPYKMSELTPIGRTVSVTQAMVVNKDLPVNTISELVAYAKKHPKTLSYSSAGVGTLPQLVMEQLNSMAQIDLQHIPYNSDLQSTTAVAGNHVQVSVITLSVVLPHVKSNAVRAIAMLTEKRDPLIPQLPTSTEQGFPELRSTMSNIWLVPAKTPAPIVKKLEAAVEKSLRDKDVKEKLEKMDYKVDFLDGREAQLFLDGENKRWGPVVKKANIVK